ncbi:DNA/RNA non-specific endonuclease [Pseudomonas sp. BCA14]|uniref:DNA/RNA non-specific endonuclease n=1 Tax=unclassified Pseudomonas TaxID=196821 RepID=UPI00106ED090|nr:MULTISPECIES: DNA/RNA non-specific endonuclease [unclassified Pseudomonas]TFF13939.1 DNA/RNA non-specific endonuclease [Pseudomonas sp. JMN1]TFF15378.1 DNA/RNA non-specific endonuclease [Pseudomonas sp. BCA17]TFF31785.1 DNA/RNA non-specific endonuclease [Pseudomonas sp. BCA14]TFF32737.1 DNA/RNA non-specific endonuclease [Pseudomonas sp. BCA13]
MQGSMKFKHLAFLLIPLVAACTTTDRTHESAVATQVMPGQAPAFDNCGVGCPTGGSPLTLNRQAYTLNNNGSTKFANWVSYRITKNTPASGRARNWATDPDIPAGETLDPVDYNGANVALKVDRGHQANLASMAGVADWPTLNYLSNITPQKSDLNQGPWARLEDQERNLAKEAGVDQVYVVTGPLYEHFVGTLPGTNKVHTIPSGYWKIIFVGSSPQDGVYASFVMNQETPKGAAFCDYQVTVNQIEERSGLTFWSNLPQPVQAALKSRQGQLPARIGCKAT